VPYLGHVMPRLMASAKLTPDITVTDEGIAIHSFLVLKI
jgi:hypothetical protein